MPAPKPSAAIFLALAGCLLLLILLLSSCKKEKKETEEKLPVFGHCKPAVPTGNMSVESSGKFVYTTNDGGKIVINQNASIVITHKDYPGFTIELWGDLEVGGEVKLSGNHENLNGKHIKNRQGSRRTIIFPGGTKMTMITDGEYGQLLSINIYDGAEIHHINPVCNTLEYSFKNLSIARQLDDAEADGETGGFEFTTTGLLFVNFYVENTVGARVTERVLLGEIFRDSPNRVNDLYDDTTLGHT